MNSLKIIDSTIVEFRRVVKMKHISLTLCRRLWYWGQLLRNGDEMVRKTKFHSWSPVGRCSVCGIIHLLVFVMALCSQLNRNRGTIVGICCILLSCSVTEFSVSVAKHLSVIYSMFVLVFVEVCRKESNVTAVLCCLRLYIFSSEVEKILFSFSGTAAHAALVPLLEGSRYMMSGWAVDLIIMYFS